MNQVGKKIVVLGLWIGIGALVGLQFGGSGSSGTVSSPVPGYSVLPAGNGLAAAGLPAAEAGAVTGYQVQPDGKGGYLYVPVTLVPSPNGGVAGTGSGSGGSAPGASAAAGQTVLPDSAAGGGLPPQPSRETPGLTPGQILVPDQKEPPVDVLADKTAGLLQSASRKGIRWIVSLFDSGE